RGTPRWARPPRPRRDAGHNLERHVRAPQRARLFAAATEQKGIPTFEANDASPEAGERNHLPFDRGLLDLRPVTDFADIDELSTRPALSEDLRTNESMVKHDVGRLEHIERPQRQQTWIARPGAHEIHGARDNRPHGALPRHHWA